MPPAVHRNIPDNAGTHVLLADQAMQDLMGVYLDRETHALIAPRLAELGELVGGRVEELALAADKTQPTLQSRTRNRAQVRRVHKHPAYPELERYAFWTFGLAAMAHRQASSARLGSCRRSRNMPMFSCSRKPSSGCAVCMGVGVCPMPSAWSQ